MVVRAHVFGCGGVGLLALAQVVQATPVVKFPTVSITQDTMQSVAILVTDSGDAALQDIEGMTFTIQIGGGTGSTPSILGIDMLSGTIWSGHVSPFNVIIPAGGAEPQFQSRSVITDVPGDYVDANGFLAIVTFDATGAAPGSYPILLTGTMEAGSDSVFYDGVGSVVPSTFQGGTLTVEVPAPSTALLALPMLFVSARRRRAQERL